MSSRARLTGSLQESNTNQHHATDCSVVAQSANAFQGCLAESLQEFASNQYYTIGCLVVAQLPKDLQGETVSASPEIRGAHSFPSFHIL